MEWRLRLGEQPSAEEYSGRYPHLADDTHNWLEWGRAETLGPNRHKPARIVEAVSRRVAPRLAALGSFATLFYGDSVITPASAWKAYEFRSKPGDVSRGLPLLAPYHRRLDWMMWFIPLSPGGGESWSRALVGRLLQNDAPTLSLMA